MSAPDASVLTACAVCTIGIGHDSPLASTVVVDLEWWPCVRSPFGPSDEDELALAGVQVEGSDPLDPVDERVEVARVESSRSIDSEHAWMSTPPSSLA